MGTEDLDNTAFGSEQSLLALLDMEKSLLAMLTDGRELAAILDMLATEVEQLVAGAICTILQLDDSVAGFHIA
ncbi:MAG: hypothetical protein WBG17_03685, partial [Burkholderiaceae bacterium]